MAGYVEEKNIIGTVIRYFIVGSLTLIFLYPFYNVLVLSLNDSLDLMRGYPAWWPRVFTFENYKTVFRSSMLGRAFLLSISRTVLTTLLGLLCNGMLAYALSRREVKGKALINQFFIITMYISGGLIPVYLQIRSLGLLNNFLVFVFPGAISVYYMLIIKSYFNGLPASVEESAKLDGCNDLRLFFSIILPMSVPVFAAIGVYYAIGQWNSWWDNYIYANKPSLTTLQLLLVRLIKEVDILTAMAARGGGSVMANPATANPLGIRMATTIVATVPILAVYPFFQKYFISGITIGAVKG
jgi:putative aldouronate transport system permease protein